MFGDLEASLSVKYKVSPRKYRNNIPSYTYWLLTNIAWLPVGASMLPAVQCTDAGNLPEEISGFVGKPIFDIKHSILKTLGIDKAKLRMAFDRLGISRTLNDLSWDTYYDILLNLPSIDPQGKKAKPVYNSLIARDEQDEAPRGISKERFFKEGRMFAKVGNEIGYFSINELFYADSVSVPAQLRQIYKFLELYPKKGASKVKRLFGVNTFSLSEMSYSISNFILHSRTDEGEADFERLKPYLYALVIDQDLHRTKLRALKNLKLKLCIALDLLIGMSGNDSVQSKLEKEGESVVLEDVAYLIADKLETKNQILKKPALASELGNIIYNVLKTDISNQVFTLALSESSDRNEIISRLTEVTDRDFVAEAKQLLESKNIGETDDNEPPAWIAPPLQRPLLGVETPTVHVTQGSGDDGLAGGGNVGKVSSRTKRCNITSSREESETSVASKSETSR